MINDNSVDTITRMTFSGNTGQQHYPIKGIFSLATKNNHMCTDIHLYILKIKQRMHSDHFEKSLSMVLFADPGSNYA